MPKPIEKKNSKGHLMATLKDDIECHLVNVKTVNGKEYRAYRGIKYNGREIEKVKEYIECDGEKICCRLKDEWNNLK